MSENKVELKELPHQFMLRKYKLTTDVLSADGKQMLKDLEKTLRLVSTNAAKKGGNINLTPATQQKITTYDRYIVDSILEYLEDKDKLTEAQADKVEEQMDDKREAVEEKMDDLYNEAQDTLEEIKEQTQTETQTNQEEVEATETDEVEATETPTETPTETKEEDDKVRIGFWDWE